MTEATETHVSRVALTVPVQHESARVAVSQVAVRAVLKQQTNLEVARVALQVVLQRPQPRNSRIGTYLLNAGE